MDENKYSNGKIYIIRNTENKLIYIGSTTQPLSKRFYAHKMSLTGKDKGMKLYSAMREIGTDKFYIELIETFPCDSKEKLLSREGHYIRLHDSFKNGYNSVISGRTTSQWLKDNEEVLKEKSKTYYCNNIDKIKQYREQIFECECGSTCRIGKKLRHFQSQKHLEFIKK